MMKQNSNLNKVIECLQDQQKSLRSKSVPTQDISKIHHHTIDLLNQFTEHIDRCKKYNQARIHRKYQNTLTVLQEENQILKSRLKLHREAIPSSQSYVNNLIDKMVEIRNMNERLMRDNQHLRNNSILQREQKQSINQSRSSKVLKNQQNQAQLISETIEKYLKRKKQPNNRKVSNFQHFLQRSSLRSNKCTLFNLFQKIEKWVQKLKETPFLDYQKIKQRFQRTHTSIQKTHPSTKIYNSTIQDQSHQTPPKMKTQHIQRPSNERIVFKPKKRYGLTTNRSEMVRMVALK